MEGFSISPAGLFQPQPGCLSCVQVKQRLDVIENYLLLKNPDFAHLRNYISTVSSAPATYDLGCGPAQNFSTSATISVREYDPTALGSSVTPTCLPYNTLGSQGVTGNNILQNGVGPGVPMEATKARRKQTLVKKPTSPSNVKRRGRKRKYPIETPNSAMAPPNLQHLHPGSNGIVKIVVPIKAPTSAAASVANSSGTNMPRTQMEGFNVGGEMRTRMSQMSSLDVLAAVSYVLKNNLGNGSVAAAVTNSVTPRDLYSAPKSYLNQGQGQVTYHLHQENGSPSEHNDMPKDANAQKTLEQELGQPVLDQHQKNYSDSNPTPGGNLFQGRGETLLSPSRSSHTADSQDEYNAIVTEAPATEITI